MLTILDRLLRDDDGQDIVEYAFLAAFFGVASYVILSQLAPTVLSTYTSWIDPTSGVPSLWDPPPPAGS